MGLIKIMRFLTILALSRPYPFNSISLMKWEPPPIILMFRINKGDIYVAKTMLIFSSDEFSVSNNQNALLHLYHANF